MSKNDMTGQELFELYTSEESDYKQVLMTAHMAIGDDLYKMLEKAERKGKKIAINEVPQGMDDGPIVPFIQ